MEIKLDPKQLQVVMSLLQQAQVTHSRLEGQHRQAVAVAVELDRQAQEAWLDVREAQKGLTQFLRAAASSEGQNPDQAWRLDTERGVLSCDFAGVVTPDKPEYEGVN